MSLGALFLVVRLAVQPSPDLTIELVGNAGVLLTDGAIALLIDLPYEPGAFGYMVYDPEELRPAGDVLSVITHHHRDHFDRDLFLQRPRWRVIGPPSVTHDLPAERVLPGDSLSIGEFAVVALPTPHTDDHRSYRVRWRGLVLMFTGDTEDPAVIAAEPRIDILFVTPWLDCALSTSGRARSWDRSILYHRGPNESLATCVTAEALEQGTRFVLAART